MSTQTNGRLDAARRTLLPTRWRLKEHWRRLLAEFVIIAVGVGVALAVDNWNDVRKERQLESEYLAGISEDLATTRQNLQRDIESAAANSAALRSLIAVAQGAPPPPDAQFTRDLIFATFLGLPHVSSITFDELVSTGSLRLIRDRDFKRKLAEFYQTFEWGSQFYEEYRRKEAATETVLRGLLPLDARLDLRVIDDLEDPVDAEAVAAELRRRPDLVAILEDSVWTQMRVELAASQLLERIEELEQMLETAHR